MSSSPFARVDHLVIAVRDLDASVAAYAAMLGLAPSWRGSHPTYGTANVLFGLANCYVELLALAPDDAPQAGQPMGAPQARHPMAAALAAYLEHRAEGLFALALGTDDLAATAARLRESGLTPGPLADGHADDGHGTTRHWRSFFLDRGETRGLSVFAIEHRDRSGITASVPAGEPSSIATAVDHVVIFSDDLAGALRLWCETFGVPERWRREFPERGTVNVGLRLGGVTLEIAAPLAGGSGERGERAWGLAYAVGDVDAAVARLRAHSVAVSEARTGLAPGTRVCTVKWADRIPTLLIEHS